MMSENMPITVDDVVDASGLNCPLPILKARKALKEMTVGQVLKVIATDPSSVDDFPVFAKATGNVLLHQKATDNQWEFFLRLEV